MGSQHGGPRSRYRLIGRFPDPKLPSGRLREAVESIPVEGRLRAQGHGES